MQKREDIQIYELAYNKVKYGLWDNALYTPLQCGADRSNTDVCELKDNTGENISSKNFYYCETTGTYWIWKNAPETKYVGQCQYRRRLEFKEDFDFDTIFDKHKIICNKPMLLGITLRKQIEKCHPYINLDMLDSVVYDKQPLYSKAYNDIFNKGTALFFSSSYILPINEYRRYCNFMFSILDEYANRMHFLDYNTLKGYVSSKLRYPAVNLKSKPIEYHMLIGGFLQERLFSVWVLSNFRQSEIYYKDFKFMEDNMKIKTYNR